MELGLTGRKLTWAVAVGCIFWTVQAQAQLKLTIHPQRPLTGIDKREAAASEVKRVAGNAQLVEEKAWANQRAQTVKDIVDYLPGVVAQPKNGAESQRLSIRGSGLAASFQGRGLLLLQDGIPINTADGEFEFPVIDPWLIRYAQVFPGANALAFGGSNFGGAINFVTPTGQTAEGLRLRGEYGSFDTAHALVSVGQKWKEGDLYAASSGFRQEGFRANNKQESARFNGNWGWQVNEETEAPAGLTLRCLTVRSLALSIPAIP